MDNEQFVQELVSLVGGTKNISSVTHCITRLRFVLKNEAKAQTEEIKKLDVLGVQKQGGQYQVVIGQRVPRVYKQLIKTFPELKMRESDSKQVEKRSFFNTILENVSSILVATLPPIVGGGMIKGIAFILTNYQLIAADGDLATVLNIVGDCMFYFFPFLLAVSAAKKFKTNEYMSLALAGALMYPTLINGAAEGAAPLKILGLQLPVINYASSVLPIIFGVLLLKYVYNFLEEKVPDMVTIIFTPLLSLIIVVPITLICLAPLGYYGGEYVAKGITWLMETSPIVAGFVIGASRPLLILVGMHHAVRAINMQEIATFKYSLMTPINFLSTMAQTFATFALFFLFKDKKNKQLALSCSFSGILGVTEPALYGLLTRYKSAMLGACLGGGFGGMIAMVMGAKAYAVVMPSILTFPVFMGGGLFSLLIGFVITIIASFTLTIIFEKAVFKTIQHKPATEARSTQAEFSQKFALFVPVKGQVIPLESLSDKTFASKMMGEGIGIYPETGHVFSPCDGVVEMAFHTKHAIGLKSDSGLEVLIHVGIDTVKMDGVGFELLIETGDKVKAGQEIIRFDIDKIKEFDLDPTVIMVVTNSKKYRAVEINPVNTQSINNEIITIID